MPDLFETTERISFTPTRKAGLARLEAFRPRMGRHYAQSRNTDLGPNERTNVSTLSPWVRVRLLREEELARAALDQFRFPPQRNFIRKSVGAAISKAGWSIAPRSGRISLNDVHSGMVNLRKTQAYIKPLKRQLRGEQALKALMTGPENWWRPVTCTIMRVCGLPQSGCLH